MKIEELVIKRKYWVKRWEISEELQVCVVKKIIDNKVMIKTDFSTYLISPEKIISEY